MEGVVRFAQGRPDWQLELVDPKGQIPPHIDGIIAQISSAELRARLRRINVPVVDTFCEQADADFIGVSPHHADIGEAAAAFFLDRGHSSFAYCGFRDSVFSDLRRTAFSAAVAAAGYSCARFDERETNCSYSLFAPSDDICRQSRAMARFLRQLPQETAVFCANDYLALRVMRLAETLKIAVPQKLSVLGVGNDPLLCALSRPPMSSICSNAEGVGYAAAKLLDAAMRNPPDRRKHRIFLVRPGEVAERMSTAYRPVRGAPWLAAVLNHIESHLSDSLATAQLSEFAGKSHTALDAAFRKNFGVSPGRYVLQLRMKTARRLLASGGLSVKEVASRMGFASHPYFSRTYRNWYGRSPTDDLPASVRKR